MSELTTVETDPTPMQLIQAAMTTGCDPDKLDKLLALQERFERNQAEREFNAAMHLVQQTLPTVVRDAKNPKTHSNYVRLETVQSVCKPKWEACGFSLNFGESDCPLERHKRTICDVRHTGGACKQYHVDLPIDGIGPKGAPVGGMNAVQGSLSTMTYAQRRLLCMIFNITVADQDMDGNLPTRVISDEQAGILEKILKQIHPDDKAEEAMLAWAQVESVDELPAHLFLQAKQGLEVKASKYQK